mgnify:CR=1 FL=1
MIVISRKFIVLLVLIVSACGSISVDQNSPSEQKQTVLAEEKNDAAIISNPEVAIIKQTWQKVSVKYFGLEGGFYGLISKDGAKLLPMNLPVKYKIDGTLLRIKGHEITDIMTIQQWGQPYQITDLELIQLGENRDQY